EWNDDDVTRARYELAPADSFKTYPIPFRARGWEQFAEQNAAFIAITGADPDLLKGIDTQRIQDHNKATNTAMAKFRSYQMSDKVSWCVIAAPSQEWADKVFPDLPKAERVGALWDAIFKSTRVDQDDPVSAWRKHTATLDEKATRLNARKYKAIHYTA